MSPALLLKLELRSDPKLLCVVRGAMEPLTEMLGFSAPDCRSIIRAVDEALSNIMRHFLTRGARIKPSMFHARAFSPGPARKQARESKLYCMIVDRPLIRPNEHGRPLDEIRPGGLGLHIIQDAMDSVEYSRTGRFESTSNGTLHPGFEALKFVREIIIVKISCSSNRTSYDI